MEDTDFVALDLGEFWAISNFKDGICKGTKSFDGSQLTYAWENTQHLLDTIEECIQEYRVEVVVEKAHSRVPTQWVQYQDVKKLCKKYRVKLVEYKTSHIKKVVTGNGRADKSEIESFVKFSEYVPSGFVRENEHEYDSVACGICYLENSKGV